MTLFILTETSAGYALLKAKDKKLLKRDDIAEEASTAEGVSNLYVNRVFQFCQVKKKLSGNRPTQ
jgi:nucleolar protein 58